MFKTGDIVALVPGAKYTNGSAIPARYFNSKIYIREVTSNGDYIISTSSAGKIGGIVSAANVEEYNEYAVKMPVGAFMIKTIIETNFYAGSHESNKILHKVKPGNYFTIIETKAGWGKVKNNLGWVKLSDVNKL